MHIAMAMTPPRAPPTSVYANLDGWLIALLGMVTQDVSTFTIHITTKFNSKTSQQCFNIQMILEKF